MVITAPIKMEMIETIPSEPMPMALTSWKKRFQKMLRFSGRLNTRVNSSQYRPI
jgi:hypothetical protein